MNAIRVPSGENDGYSTQRVDVERGGGSSHPGRRGSRGAAPPSRSELNAIVVPSGDQSGPQSFAGSLVMFRRSEPSARATKISSSSLMPRVESR